jgi:thiamine biosynthesis protein ThiI
MELARIVSEYTGPIEMNIVSLTEIQREIHMKCPKEYMITLVRRFMLRIANIIAEKENCKALVTGESLGQVASQTLESIGVISAVSKLQILRPLIGMDKSEIISIADKIGTFKTSIEPYEDCCTVFLPENPVIRPTIDRAFAAEEALDVDKLIEDALNTLERVKISKA